MHASATFDAIGVLNQVTVDEPGALDEARHIAAREVAALDRACSRFRDDSELSRLNRGGGGTFAVSPLLFDALEVGRPCCVGYRRTRRSNRRCIALRARLGSRFRTGGHPTARARALRACACRRLAVDPPRRRQTAGAHSGRRRARSRRDREGVRGRPHRGADRCGDRRRRARQPRRRHRGAWRTARRLAGPRHRRSPPRERPGSSSRSPTAASRRRARRSGGGGAAAREMHHIVDPATGAPAAERWRTVSVAAATCVDANTASTAAIVRGPDAPAWLEARNLPARLVAADGAAVNVAGWPAEAEAA